LRGIWAALPVIWSADDEIDEAALRENVRRACQARVHGVYTHGTTGEFYAQSEKEWAVVTSATIEEARQQGVPVQIGCTALWTKEVIRRVCRAQEFGADGVQIAFPFWMPLTDKQALRFLKDVAHAAPGMPIILYNTDRAKKPLTPDLLENLFDSQVPIIGIKGNPQSLRVLHSVAARVSFFVGEPHLAPCWESGVCGSYSSFVLACPRFMLRYFTLCAAHDDEAFRIASVLKRFLAEWVVPRLDKGMYDTALDRTIAATTNFLSGRLLASRPPYDAATPEDVDSCREWFALNLPEFITEI
jgi:dihydrodipicolinate synthase/N-acetylneuraminate lyase